MSRIYNFSAGPAVLPLEVLEQAREEITDWHGSGMSVMEMSHRGPEFTAIAGQAESDLRELLAVPDDYKVLFLQGGATTQFACVPFNLAQADSVADYLVTGSWSKKAVTEAGRFCRARIAADSATTAYVEILPPDEWSLDPDAAYLHYTPNETIGGVEFHFVPDSRGVPLVADMSSNILSRPIDIGKFGVIYAGAQKNMGPAGLTLVIVRKNLLGLAREGTPRMMDYAPMAAAGSMLNTPSTYSWYIAGLVFGWLLDNGGLEQMEQQNRGKAKLLYSAIDQSGFYSNPVREDCRSLMNVPFTLADAELDASFLSQAAEADLRNLKGHRSVGGMRASIYNAMPAEGVQALVDFMGDFEQRYG
jgi:phosphoserine aminotransferase